MTFADLDCTMLPGDKGRSATARGRWLPAWPPARGYLAEKCQN